jgi:glycosyl transferase, family 25
MQMSRNGNGSAQACPDQPPGATDDRWATFLINLDRATERYAFIERQLRNLGITFTRISAIDGNALTLPIPEVSEWSHKLLHGRYISPSEVGCYLSHIKAIDLFLATNLDYCLILEDDAVLDKDLKAIINAAIAYHDDWDILRLSTVNTGRHFIVRKIKNRGLGVCFTREKGAAGYVLNRRAARRFRRWLLPMRLAYDIAFDLEYFLGLKALAVKPLPISQRTEFATQIQTSIRKLPAWRYLTVFPFRTILEVSRVVCRISLYLWLLLKPLVSSGSRSRQAD